MDPKPLSGHRHPLPTLINFSNFLPTFRPTFRSSGVQRSESYFSTLFNFLANFLHSTFQLFSFFLLSSNFLITFGQPSPTQRFNCTPNFLKVGWGTGIFVAFNFCNSFQLFGQLSAVNFSFFLTFLKCFCNFRLTFANSAIQVHSQLSESWLGG